VPEPPPSSGLAAGPLWSGFLDHARAEIVAGVMALDPEARRRTLVPSGWTPLELLSHCLHMEQRWFVWGFLGEHVDDPWGDWTADEPWGDDTAGDTGEARWQVDEGVNAEDLVERLEAIAVRTRSVLHDHQVSEVASSEGRFTESHPTLEWICMHVLAEYARHAGHLDIVVELSP